MSLVLASHARRSTLRSSRAQARPVRHAARRQPRPPLLAGFVSRRRLLHVFCLGLVCLAASGPLAALSMDGTRSEVTEAVQGHMLFLAAQADARSPGGWNIPVVPLTIAEVAVTNPPELVVPLRPSSFILDTPPAAEESPRVQVPTRAAAPVAPLPSNPARDAARAALAQRFKMISEAYGIVVLDAEGVPLFEHRATEQFQAASLYKLGVAAEVYRQQKLGMIALKDPMIITREALVEGDTIFVKKDVGRKITIGEALDFMITRSSNVAAILLLKRLGPYNVNDLFEELGLKETRLLERPFRNIDGNAKNQTTPKDIARFFDLLLHGKIVDVESSQALIKLMLRQKIDDRLPSALPRGVPVAHKTGNLVGVVHDAGIIYSPAGPLIVVGLSENIASEEEAYATIAQLARVAYDAYIAPSAQP
jgi:beta-lactamase class A